MGFIKGARVSVIKCAPLMNPIEYSVGDAHVTLRRKEAMHIVVESTASRGPGRGLGCGRGGRGGRGFGPGRGKRRRWWRRGTSE